MLRTVFKGGVAIGAVMLATAARAESVAVDEIVVTAQKREQNLQDVPIVVTALGSRALRDAGVQDIKDLTILTPGLTVTSSASTISTTARIRGVGTVGDNIGLESSVGVVIDGVSRPRNGVGFGDLGELERIEVLKGPQGTLFGKNATAGVINILTKRPSFTSGAAAEATVSNYEGYGLSASVTGPIVEDRLAGRLFAARRTRDGYVDVDVGAGPRSRGDDFDQNYFTSRGQLLWTPSSALSLALGVDYTRQDERCCASLQVFNSPAVDLLAAAFPGAVETRPDFGREPAHLNRDTLKRIDDGGVSLQADWSFGRANLTSITAYRDYRAKNGTDFDLTGADLLWTDIGWAGARFRDFSQELRLAGRTDRLDWLVGGFFSHQDLISRVGMVYGRDFEAYLSRTLTNNASATYIGDLAGSGGDPVFAAGQGQHDRYDQSERTFALFANGTWSLTPRLEATAGLRYTWGAKDLDSQYDNTDGGAGCAAVAANPAAPSAVVSRVCQSFQNPNFNGLATRQRLREEALSGTLKAAYRFNPQAMAYLSYARGYKAGGFNLDRQANPYAAGVGGSLKPIVDTHFAPEFVDSYEAGVKTTLLDRRLLLNATAFHQTFSDFQLNAYNGLIFTVVSAPEVTSRGVDVDFVFLPVGGLTLQGGATYAETQYGGTSAAVLGAGSRLPDARLSFAPLWSGSLSGAYQRDIGGQLVARASLSAKYASSYNTGSDLNPLKVQSPVTIFNARVSAGPRSGRWSAEVWARNLTDERYFQVAHDAVYQAGGIGAFPAPPRTFGATLRLSY